MRDPRETDGESHWPCQLPCDDGCEAGHVHCWNWHRPRRKRDWHDPRGCDQRHASGAFGPSKRWLS